MVMSTDGTDWSEIGRLMSLRRPLRDLVCAVCGTPFQARNLRARYCSPRCLMRQRRADQRKQDGTTVVS